MFRISISFVLFIIASSQVFSQKKLEGYVKDEKTKNPIPYCSIGIPNSRVGAISNKEGKYSINIPEKYIGDTIIFSSVGYGEKKLKIAELHLQSDVTLSPQIIDLDEVVIVGKKMKQKIIGLTHRPFLSFAKKFDENVLMMERGNLFKIYDYTDINSFSFHIISSSKYASVTLKINIYDVVNGVPSKSVLKRSIIYKTKTTGWQNIDLKKYNIHLRNLSEVAFSVQLVDFEKKEDDFVFGISAKKSTSKKLLFRYQSEGKWEKHKGRFLMNIGIKYH